MCFITVLLFLLSTAQILRFDELFAGVESGIPYGRDWIAITTRLNNILLDPFCSHHFYFCYLQLPFSMFSTLFWLQPSPFIVYLLKSLYQ